MRSTSVHVVGRARKVSYIGKIVSSGRHGVVLQLADGRRVRVGKTAARKNTRRARAAGSVSISLSAEGLLPILGPRPRRRPVEALYSIVLGTLLGAFLVVLAVLAVRAFSR